MSFKINGETWQPQTATEHADNIIQKLNELLQIDNVRDINGEVVQLKQSYGNALYLLALGDGNRFAENDAKLERAKNSFNIELCDDEQIENLLPIAAVTRNPGSYSTLELMVTASEDGDCLIPKGTKAPYGEVNFVVDNDTVVSAGSSVLIGTTCDVLGPVAVLSGEVTAFDTQIANLESVENLQSSVPGVAAESTEQLRKRLIDGDTIKYSINGCKNALEELTGIIYARVYFNANINEPLELPGGVELEPRTAYIVVYGSSDRLAEVYSEYMSAPTQNSPIGEGTPSTLKVTVKADNAGDAVLPVGTSVSYNDIVFAISEQITVSQNTSQEITFTCTVIGANTVPAYAVSALDQTVANVESVYNTKAAVPGTADPKHVQNWITESGQAIPVYYDDATEQNVFVRVWLAEDAESGTQVDNQIKRDLIVASSEWKIGESVTQLLTSKPFVNCSYTTVAYTEISTDGVNWQKVVNVGCNVIPRLTDSTITIEQLGD